MASDPFSYDSDSFFNDLNNFPFDSAEPMDPTQDVLELYTNAQATDLDDNHRPVAATAVSVAAAAAALSSHADVSRPKRQMKDKDEAHQRKSFSQVQLPTPSRSGDMYGTSEDMLMSPLMMPGTEVMENLEEEEDMILLTPLLSPAMTPVYPFSHPPMSSSENFSPLTSPALQPSAPTTVAPNSTRAVPTKRTSSRSSDSRVKRSATGPTSKRVRSTTASNAVVPLGDKQQQQQQQQLQLQLQQLQQQQETPLATEKSNTSTDSKASAQAQPPALHQPDPVVKPGDSPLLTPTTPTTPTISTGKPASVAMPPPPSPATALAPVTPASLMKLLSSSPSPNMSPVPPSPTMVATLPVLISPALRPVAPGTPILFPGLSSPMLAPSPMMAPAAMDRRLVSPSLKPKVSSQEAAERLATKSNYRILADGETASTGLNYSTDLRTGATQRRTSHKAAEQKRRDHLRRHFDDLRAVLPDLQEKGSSKVYLLKKSYDYILQLKSQNNSKDARANALANEVAELRVQLGLPPLEEELDVDMRLEMEMELDKEVKIEDVETIKVEELLEDDLSGEDTDEREGSIEAMVERHAS